MKYDSHKTHMVTVSTHTMPEMELRSLIDHEEWLAFGELIDNLPPGAQIAEIGSASGGSALLLAQSVGGTLGRVWAIDIWENEKQLVDFLQAICLRDFAQFVTPIRITSLEAANVFRDKFFDMIFIDASHKYIDVSADIGAWLPKLKRDGIFCGHDIDEPDVERAVKENFEYRILEGSRIWVKNSVV